MKILVLGGTRFTGPHIVRRLVELGHSVTVFHRGRSGGDLPPGVAHLHGEKGRLPEMAGELRALAPDVVLHMMAVTEADARVFVETFRGSAGRAVVISSGDVYRAYGRLHGTEPGPPDPIPFAENSPLREKLSIHGSEYDKTAVERIVMSEPELPGTALRYPAVYGPGDAQHRLYPYLKRMDDRRPFILLDDVLAAWRFSHGYSEDVAIAAALAVTEERATGRIYNVAAPETPAWADWVREIGRHAGWDGEVIAVPKERLPVSLVSKEDLRHHLVVDTTRIREELGYREAVPRDQGLRRTIAWERAHPPEQPGKSFDYAAEDAALAALGYRTSRP